MRNRNCFSYDIITNRNVAYTFLFVVLLRIMCDVII